MDSYKQRIKVHTHDKQRIQGWIQDKKPFQMQMHEEA